MCKCLNFVPLTEGQVISNVIKGISKPNKHIVWIVIGANDLAIKAKEIDITKKVMFKLFRVDKDLFHLNSPDYDLKIWQCTPRLTIKDTKPKALVIDVNSMRDQSPCVLVVLNSTMYEDFIVTPKKTACVALRHICDCTGN